MTPNHEVGLGLPHVPHFFSSLPCVRASAAVPAPDLFMDGWMDGWMANPHCYGLCE